MGSNKNNDRDRKAEYQRGMKGKRWYGGGEGEGMCMLQMNA